ncbi:MAG TPA: glycosyltransferase family 39 protein, partial [Chloroflexota bacterium]|nr:glycosyltransferase family 39 protein [Chloroflexota bacterium]
MTGRRARLAGLVAIVTFGVILRSWGLGWGLFDASVGRRTHPDEWVVYWLAQWFGQNHTLNPCPHPGTECFLDWGAAFPYAAFLAKVALTPLTSLLDSAAFGHGADPAFVSAVFSGRLVSVLTSGAAIVVAYLAGREAFGETVGLWTALLIALSTLLVQLAHFATPDSTTLLLFSLAMLSILRLDTHATALRFAVGGGLIGAATASEFHMMLLFAPLAVAWLLAPGRRALWLPLAAAGAVAVFLALNPYILVDLSAFITATEHTLRIRTTDSAAEYQNRWSPYGPAWLFVVRYDLGYGEGFAITGWMLAGLLRALWRRSRPDLILLSWIVPYFMLVTVSPAKFMRYGAPLLLPLAILGARFGIELWRTGDRRLRPAVLALGVAAIAYTAIYDGAYAGLFAVADPRAVAASLVPPASPKPTTIAFEAPPDGILNLPEFFPPGTLRPCFSSGALTSLLGAPFVMTDSFTRDETPQS